MICTWLCLDNIFDEKVVFSRHKTIVLNVENPLWKVFPFAIGIETEITDVETKSVEPLFRAKIFIKWSVCVNCPRAVHVTVRLNDPDLEVAVIGAGSHVVLVVNRSAFNLNFFITALWHGYSNKRKVTYKFGVSIENHMDWPN